MSDVLRFDLAKDPKGNPITYGRVGDSNGLTRRVKVFEDGKPLDLTGWATTFEGNTSNWKTKVFDTEGINIIDATKGDFSYTFPNMAFAVEGQYERAYFSFIKGDQRKSTGDFEIIVLGNSDIDAPEAETIITEYNKLVAELNELQNQAIDEMNRNFTEAQGRISELEVQINDLRNKIDQALTDFENGNFWTKEESFNKEESSANVIDQVIGKVSNENKVILDLKGKIVGSAVENPNDAKVTHTQTLLNPNSTDFFTLSQQAYDQQKDLDGVVLTVSNSLNGRFRQNVYSWDILTVTKKIVGDVFFEGLNADTVAKQVAILKKMVNVKTAVWGFGSNYSGNKLSLKIWGNDTSWIGEANHTEATISKLEYDSTLNTNSFISEDGFVYVTAFSEPSDGNTASSLSVDYANLELEFNSSVHEYINNMIAAYSGENIDKKFVGLENVDNYGTATQAEAESGTATDKFMTPLRTKQHVSSRIATQAEAETGTSNSKVMTPIRTKQFYDQQAIERPKFLSNATNFCAHRGNNAEFPENSVMALKSVTRHRFTEFDVDITKDGKWVVMHDDTVDRTTNGTGRVDSLTLAQIRALRIDTGAGLGYLTDAEKIIPTMSEAIQYCKSAGSVPFVEIKSNNYTDSHLQEFINVLKQAKILNGGCVVISFDKTILERLRNMSNEIELSWVMNSVTQTELSECIRLRMSADVAYNHATVTKDMVNAFHDNGLQFNVWTAPDDSFESLKEKGVDVITTNSRSGDLRWSLLTLDSNFTHYAAGGNLRQPFVEEVSPGVAKVTFTVTDGVNTKQTRLLIFPDWATPVYTSWHLCNIRTSSGSDFATVDVYGKALSADMRGVVVGLNWDARTTWANGSFTYDLY